MFGPPFPASGVLVQDGDRVLGTPNMYGGGQGRYGSAITTSVAVRLDRVGAPLESQSYLALNAAVSPEKAVYRLRVESARRAVLGLTTRSSVAWTFTSARTAGVKPLPLSVLRFKPAVGERNVVVGGCPYGFCQAASASFSAGLCW